MRPLEATEKIRDSKSDDGHDEISRNHTEDYVLFELGNSGKLELRAEHKKGKGSCYV